MSSESITRAYDEWHDQFGVDKAADSPWHDLVKKHIGAARGLVILEIGCGRGGFASWMDAHEPGTYVAADFSWSAVSKTGNINGAFSTEQADITRLPHPDHSFDVIVSCETIEHVPDPAGAVREMARALRSGGRLLLTTPNYMNLMGVYRAYRRLARRPFTEEGQPINNFTTTPRTMAWFRSAGLAARLVDSCGHYVPFPRRRPIRLAALDSRPSAAQWFASHQLIVGTKL